jgi:hypothetical protein
MRSKSMWINGRRHSLLGIRKGEQLPRAWCRTAYTYRFTDGTVDLQEQRRLCGLKPITTAPKQCRRMENVDSSDSDNDTEPEEQMDVDLGGPS